MACPKKVAFHNACLLPGDGLRTGGPFFRTLVIFAEWCRLGCITESILLQLSGFSTIPVRSGVDRKPRIDNDLHPYSISGSKRRRGHLGRNPKTMAVLKDEPRNGRMTHVERLLVLFRAFRERDDDAFHRAAEAIIADELTANHHAQARDLQKALSANGEKPPLPRPNNRLSVLPKDRRNGEPLVNVVQPRPDANRVILSPEPRMQIDRVLQEHSQRSKLARFGYHSKTKLLFWGPPGCGKTLTAHSIANELGFHRRGDCTRC